jgi:hypothetical protein
MESIEVEDGEARKLRSFINALKILRSLDEHEIDGCEEYYADFRDNPYVFLMRCNCDIAEKIWAAIQRRQPEELR